MEYEPRKDLTSSALEFGNDMFWNGFDSKLPVAACGVSTRRSVGSVLGRGCTYVGEAADRDELHRKQEERKRSVVSRGQSPGAILRPHSFIGQGLWGAGEVRRSHSGPLPESCYTLRSAQRGFNEEGGGAKRSERVLLRRPV